MKKKAQVKFGESIGILFIIYIVIMTGLMWYNKVNNNNLQEIYFDDQFDRAFEKYYYINNLDFIHVSENGITQNTFDLDSLIVFSNYSKTKKGKLFLKKELGDCVIKLSIYNNDELDKNPRLNLTLYENEPNSEVKQVLQSITFKSVIPVKNNEGEIQIGILDIVTFITK